MPYSGNSLWVLLFQATIQVHEILNWILLNWIYLVSNDGILSGNKLQWNEIKKLCPSPKGTPYLSIFEQYLFIVFDLILQDDSIWPVRLQPSQGNAVPCYLLSLDQCNRGWSCQKEKKNYKHLFSFNEEHVFLVVTFTIWALSETVFFLGSGGEGKLEALKIFPVFSTIIAFNHL